MKRGELLLHPESNRFLDQIVANLPHAVIISGAAGTGKRLLAQALAAELLATPLTLENQPYYRQVTPVKSTITIEQIRSLIQFFQLQVPGQARVKRVAVIADADTMGTEAQNALLKLLEEPPEGSILLLTTSRLTGLLPTVRSRAQTLALPDPSTRQISDHFLSLGNNAGDIQAALLRHGVNIAAISQELAAETTDMTAMLQLVKQVLGGSQYDRLLLVDGLAKQREQAVDFADALASVALASLQSAAANARPVARWQSVLLATNTAQEALARSGNAKLVLSELMLAL